MEDSQILEKIKGQVDKIGFADSIDVTPESHLTNDLGMDSLDAMDLITRIEQEFDIKISDDEGGEAQTIQDVIDIIKSKI
jgi:acyl carrier protein